jgi:hypothetical protein
LGKKQVPGARKEQTEEELPVDNKDWVLDVNHLDGGRQGVYHPLSRDYFLRYISIIEHAFANRGTRGFPSALLIFDTNFCTPSFVRGKKSKFGIKLHNTYQ